MPEGIARALHPSSDMKKKSRTTTAIPAPTKPDRTPPSHRPRQLPLLQPERRFFGGRLLYGRRKSKRPLSSKDPIHIVMRSTWAMGPYLLLRTGRRAAIERLIKDLAERYHVRVYERAIAGNHIHLVVRVPHTRNYKAFIRVLTGKIASLVMGGRSFKEFVQDHPAGDGSTRSTTALEPQGKGQQFWQFRPFTRVAHWGRDFKNCCEYVVQNRLEALGFAIYKPRGRDRYSRWIIETLDFILV